MYRRIGEFVVTFQWLENRSWEIGWYILNPGRSSGPVRQLRDLTTARLVDAVSRLFFDGLPKCRLDPELEEDLREAFAAAAERFHRVRKARNSILHSAYIELKAGGEVQALLRSNPQLVADNDPGEKRFDQELLSETSFDSEMREMAEVALVLNRCYAQLLQRYPA